MRRIVVLGMAACFASGCASGADEAAPPIAQDWPEADKRFVNEAVGVHDQSYTFRMTDALFRFAVKARYETDGQASFVLKDPENDGVKRDTFLEARSLRSESWFGDTQPLKGTWTLSVHLAEGGRYAFGVYFN